MTIKIPLLFLSLSFMLCKTAASQKTLKVYYHSNGYRGNLYYRVFDNAGIPKARKWFYVKNQSDSIVLPAEPGGGFELYSGWISFSFKYESGKAVLKTPKGAAKVINTTDHSIEISFNTAKVGIETSGLTYNYMLSAFAHIPSRDSADEAYRALHGSKTFTLIKGMFYGLNTQAYNAFEVNKFKKMLCNPPALGFDNIPADKESVINTRAKDFPGVPDDAFLDALTFTVNEKGRVIVDSSGAAHAYKNRVILNNVNAYINPACISRGNEILILNDATTFHHIKTPTHIKVMKGLLNHLRWYAGKEQHDYFYIWLPGYRQHGKKS